MHVMGNKETFMAVDVHSIIHYLTNKVPKKPFEEGPMRCVHTMLTMMTYIHIII